MRTFAEIDNFGTVLRVIVIEPEMLATGRWGDPANWIETKEDGSERKNYASIQYTYSARLDAFVPQKPSETAILNETTAQWVEPGTEKNIV